MRAVIQRVKQASVTVDGKIISEIKKGLLILLGVEDVDKEEDVKWLSSKISKLRIFDDENNIMNKSVLDVAGNCIVVSQFTLFASTKKGNRPTYIRASKSEFASSMYNNFLSQLEKDMGKNIGRGIFGENMQVSLINDGPVTIIIDTNNKE